MRSLFTKQSAHRVTKQLLRRSSFSLSVVVEKGYSQKKDNFFERTVTTRSCIMSRDDWQEPAKVVVVKESSLPDKDDPRKTPSFGSRSNLWPRNVNSTAHIIALSAKRGMGVISFPPLIFDNLERDYTPSSWTHARFGKTRHPVGLVHDLKGGYWMTVPGKKFRCIVSCNNATMDQWDPLRRNMIGHGSDPSVPTRVYFKRMNVSDAIRADARARPIR